MKKSIIRNPIH